MKELSNSKKQLLLIDLDETLIHSEFNSIRSNSYTKEIYFKDEETKELIKVNINKRPEVEVFLNNLSNYFNLAIFTAGEKDYADAVIKTIDPRNEIFKFRLDRYNCIAVNDFIYIKDLKILEDYFDLKNVLLLDNSIHSFTNQINNGILINSFFDDPFDYELINVFQFLMTYCYNQDDVRIINKNFFGFEDFLFKIQLKIKKT